MKKKRMILAAGGVCTVLVVVILAVFLYQPKEIDQKVLFIYRQVNTSMGGDISVEVIPLCLSDRRMVSA